MWRVDSPALSQTCSVVLTATGTKSSVDMESINADSDAHVVDSNFIVLRSGCNVLPGNDDPKTE